MFTQLLTMVRAVRRATGAAFAVDLTPLVEVPPAGQVRFIDRAEPHWEPDQLMYGGWQPWDGTGQTSWDD